MFFICTLSRSKVYFIIEKCRCLKSLMTIRSFRNMMFDGGLLLCVGFLIHIVLNLV